MFFYLFLIVEKLWKTLTLFPHYCGKLIYTYPVIVHTVSYQSCLGILD
jgi:hypothetical protein